MPSLSFLSSSPPTESLRLESDPPGAEVKTSSGQTCRTPCELSVKVAPELSATFALNGYQPQTVSVRSDAGSKLAPNPVYVELRAAPAAPPAKKRVKKKPPPPAGEAARANSPVASAAPPAPPPMSSAAPAASPAPEAAASATNYPWPEPPSAK
jgi:hypothetical protein